MRAGTFWWERNVVKKFLLMNGPNLDMLGVREPGVYGSRSLGDLEAFVAEHAALRGAGLDCFQSNSEGELVEKIHDARGMYDGIVYNPGAHTHYSYALRDAIGGIDVPCVEVHISDVDAREPFRAVSVIAPACVAQVKGRGFQGYCDGLDILLAGATERLGEGYERSCVPGQVVLPSGSPQAVRLAAEGAVLDSAGVEGSDAEGVLGLAPAPEDELAVLGNVAAPNSPNEHPDSSCRLNALRSCMVEQGLGAFLVRDTSNIRYFTAFDGVFDDERAHGLFVSPDEAVLHTDSRYSEAAQTAAQRADGVVRVDCSRQGHGAFALGCVRELCERVRPDVVQCGTAFPLGIEDSMSLAEYRTLERGAVNAAEPGELPLAVFLQETSDAVLKLRAVKDGGEVARMRAAQAITDAAFSHIVGFMRPGMTERQVQLELESFMLAHGAEGLAFASIVAAGPNGASPHAIPGNTVLEAGQCVVLDFGARAFGYCSDMTRTVFLGQPTEPMRAVYQAIREANEAVEAALRPGVTGAAMHELAEQVLADHGFGGKMGHGLGHGVGLDIHELPNLSPRNPDPLVAGNVVTVEPGVYLPGEFGMRLEDFGVVTAEGFDVFTRSAHDMVVL